MEEIRNHFPNFVPNQVLTSGQLNALREYLDQQDRLSRVRLSGTGDLCGLHVEWLTTSKTVKVSNGLGISSDGYLLELAASRFSHYRKYIDPGKDKDGVPDYAPWRARPTLRKQISMVELLTSDDEADGALSAEMIAGKVVVLYLEFSEQDLRSCLVTDCNNNGSRYVLTLRVLLVNEADLEALPGCGEAPEAVAIPRLHTVEPLSAITTEAQLNGNYRKIVKAHLPTLVEHLNRAVRQYNLILPIGERENRVVERFERLMERAIERREVNQYHYDLLCDIATAYNEFIVAACRWIPDCLSAEDHPRHLMLDHLDGKPGFRHHFQPASIRSHWQGDVSRVAGMLQRLLMLLDEINLGAVDAIRITPSHVEQEPLGARAVPHYFTLSRNELGHWRPDDCCTPTPPWRYHGPDDQLDWDYRRCSLMRIEGHVEKVVGEGRYKISALRKQFNAEFDLLILYLRGAARRETEILEKLGSERVARIEAEKVLSEFLVKSVEADALAKESFLIDYKERLSSLRVVDEKVRLFEKARIELAVKYKPLCSLGHLEADYGALRTELICLFNHLRGNLKYMRDSQLPRFGTVATGDRIAAIRDVTDSYKTVVAAIEEETNSARLAELERKRMAVEAEKITLEAESTLLYGARKITPLAITKTAVIDVENLDLSAAKALEKVSLIREASDESAVKMAGHVTAQSVEALLLRLQDQLPESLAAFDLGAFMAIYKQLVSALIEWRLMVLATYTIIMARIAADKTSDAERVMLVVLMNSLRLETQDLQHAVMSLQHACRRSQLVYLYHLYQYHKEHDSADFASFAARHPGMEHLAGVEKGGTFILVAENDEPDARIVADFALRGKLACCCTLPDHLCLPPVAIPDYRIAYLRISKTGQGYLPVVLDMDVLGNDFDPNPPGKQRIRQKWVELLSETSEMGAKLELDNSGSVIHYRLEGVETGGVDRFRYRLKARSEHCSGDDLGEVMILLVPEIKPEPQFATITGRVTWHKDGITDAVVVVRELNRQVPTGAEGNYLIENLPAGTYTLVAVLWGGEVKGDPVTVTLAAGETAQVNFDLPVQPEPQLGDFTARVVDGEKQPISRATVSLLNASGKAVATTSVMGADSIYSLTSVPAGTYTLQVIADGFTHYMERGVTITTGVVTRRVVTLLVAAYFVPERTVEFVAIADNTDDKTAIEKVSEVYTDRRAEYLSAIATAAEESAVGTTDTYTKGEEFVSKTLQDPTVDEKTVIREYETVSKAIATSVEEADDATRTDYRILLENVTKAFMDRVTLANPDTVTPEAEAALTEMKTTVSGAGIDTKVLSESWKGEELGSRLNIRTIDAVTTLAGRNS